VGRFDGTVAFVTGAARGQGRSHAVRFAKEGADVIAVDICKQIPSVDIPLATPSDLGETVRLVEALGRRIVWAEADVRDASALEKVVAEGVSTLGRIDFVIANAGVVSMGTDEPDPLQAFRDVVDVNLTGVWNTVTLSLPTLLAQGRGSVVITSSTAGIKGIGGPSGGGQGYAASKHAVVGLMRNFVMNYSAQGIRFNTVHPTGVNTPMIVNELMAKIFAEAPDMADAAKNLLPVDMVEPDDISNAVLWLCSEEARYVTGVALPIDAGFTVR